MATLHEDVQALLATLAPAGGVWFQQNTKQQPVFPFITWLRVVSVANVNLEGPSDMQNTRIQVDVFSLNANEAHALAKQVRDLMFNGQIKCAASTVQDVYEDAILAYRVIQDFSLWATN